MYLRNADLGYLGYNPPLYSDSGEVRVSDSTSSRLPRRFWAFHKKLVSL